FLSG
ncbi:hypothetical protein D031_4036B, partial [Vibrio parahaemolyticus VP-48]